MEPGSNIRTLTPMGTVKAESKLRERIQELSRAHLLANALGLSKGVQETERQIRELRELLGQRHNAR